MKYSHMASEYMYIATEALKKKHTMSIRYQYALDTRLPSAVLSCLNMED